MAASRRKVTLVAIQIDRKAHFSVRQPASPVRPHPMGPRAVGLRGWDRELLRTEPLPAVLHRLEDGLHAGAVAEVESPVVVLLCRTDGADDATAAHVPKEPQNAPARIGLGHVLRGTEAPGRVLAQWVVVGAVGAVEHLPGASAAGPVRAWLPQQIRRRIPRRVNAE